MEGVAEGKFAEGDNEMVGSIVVRLAVGVGEGGNKVGVVDGGFDTKIGELEGCSAAKLQKGTS
jgi:hypothetical protein